MPGKRPRTAAAASSFDESLDDLEVAVARISGAEPHSVSADQLRRLKELKHLLFRKEMEVDSLARAKKRARVAAEVVLPLDLLTHAFLPLDLKYLVAASQTCRHFKLAVSRAVTVRGNQIGLRQGDAEKLSLKTLAPLEEKAAQVRALMASIDQRSSQQQLIRLLSARSGGSREERALGPLLLCRHEAALWARVEVRAPPSGTTPPALPSSPLANATAVSNWSRRHTTCATVRGGARQEGRAPHPSRARHLLRGPELREWRRRPGIGRDTETSILEPRIHRVE